MTLCHKKSISLDVANYLELFRRKIFEKCDVSKNLSGIGKGILFPPFSPLKGFKLNVLSDMYTFTILCLYILF